MPLDWLFGNKRKSEPEPPLPTFDDVALQGSSAEDFVLIQNEQSTISSSAENMRPNAALPYSLAPSVGTSEKSGVPDVSINQNFLHDVPFKLAAHETFQDIDSATAYQIRASQLISYIDEKLSSGTFNYDFKVERSVLREAGSRDIG